MFPSIRFVAFLSLAVLVTLSSQAMAIQVPGPLVETAWLAEHADQVVILDVRKSDKSFAARPKPVKAKPGEKPELNLQALTGHIPGAVSVPWKKFMVAMPHGDGELMAMAPSREAFEKLVRYVGVNDDSAVVIVGRGVHPMEMAHAARFYWTLKYFGHENVALLNGGTAQWAKEERPLAYDQPMPATGNFTVSAERDEWLATTEEILNSVKGGDRQLVDARTADHFLGLTFTGKFVTPQARGHLPGAANLPLAFVSNSAGPATLLDRPILEAAAELQGVDLNKPTTAYCYTGVSASLTWFVMHEVFSNPDVDLYDGSMHAWSRDAAMPVERMAALQ